MAAKTKFTEDDILDGAERVVGTRGLDGASIAHIAESIGAPNGSIYHRFASKQHLLGALWVRIATAYRDVLLTALDADDRDIAAKAVSCTFDWVERNSTRAELLMRFRTEDFIEADWPTEVVDQIKATNATLVANLATVATRLNVDVLDMILAVIDIPAAFARRSILLNDAKSNEHLRRRASQLSESLLAPREPSVGRTPNVRSVTRKQ